MKTLCYVLLYEGKTPFGGGTRIEPSSDQLICWKIQACDHGVFKDRLGVSHGPCGALRYREYRGKPVFNAEEFSRYYKEITGETL